MNVRLGWLVIVGSLPIAILGLAFADLIETKLRSLWVVAITLVVFGIILGIADRIGRRQRNLTDMTWGSGIGMGFAQALALIPGVSRSGGTITAGLLLGFDRATAARFSFLLAIPAVVASGLLETYRSIAGHAAQAAELGPTAVATVIAFLVGLAVIAGLMKYLDRGSFAPFVIYRVVLGLALMGLLSAGVLQP